jgi:DoxX
MCSSLAPHAQLIKTHVVCSLLFRFHRKETPMATYPGTASAPPERRTSSAPLRAGGGVLRLFYTESDVGLAIGRLLLGVVMFPHAAQKVFGWFGGYGYQATMAGFEHMGIPPSSPSWRSSPRRWERSASSWGSSRAWPLSAPRATWSSPR